MSINITMSNAFTNFLGGVMNGLVGPDGDLKDYQHADRLYARNNYARAPKVGFLYFVTFNINPDAVLDKTWAQKGRKEVGLLVKRVDLPKFTVSTETINQYNKKTVVQSKVSYGNVNFEFHDDNSDITTDLWRNYYQYYYADSVYGESANGKTVIAQYGDTKYGIADFAYGFDNYQNKPFFSSIDIYMLHKGHGPQDFTQITLVNPMVTDWSHDTLNQEEGNRPMTNKMTVAYETVFYKKGKIVKNKSPEGFAPVYYDTSPSPLSIAGGIPGTLFGAGGIIAGAGSIFGEDGSLANAKSPLDYLGVALQTKNLVQGIGQLNKAKLKSEGYSILGGVLGEIRATGNQPGGAADVINNSVTSGLRTGVNLFSNKNSSINGTTQATPKNITGGG